MDEQFRVNASNGTATLSLSLPFTPSRDGFVPPVRLGLKAARAANPTAQPDDAAAAAAIRETVAADTSDRVNALFNAPVRDSHGNVVAPSYSEIRARAPWASRPPDVSLSDGEFVYDPNLRLQAVP
jgi:hypothetical protein